MIVMTCTNSQFPYIYICICIYIHSPQACAQDFATLNGIIDELWNGSNAQYKPKLIGPDETPDNKFLATFLQVG